LKLAVAATIVVALPIGLLACHDVSDFSTVNGGVYEGSVTSARFIRAGIGGNVSMCLTLDAQNLQASSPGTLSTSEGLFHATPLRSIPQIWSDPLSTLNFGEGRIQNVIYVAHGNATDAGVVKDGGDAVMTLAGDVFVVVSFMVSGMIEVRLLRGAPGAGGAVDAGASSAQPPQVFGVFTLSRMTGSCPF
jgi:hypothetical protein